MELQIKKIFYSSKQYVSVNFQEMEKMKNMYPTSFYEQKICDNKFVRNFVEQ